MQTTAGENRYVLMNRDVPVLEFLCRRNEFDEPEFFECQWHTSRRPIGYRGLASFLERRKAPKHRKHIQQLLEQYGWPAAVLRDGRTAALRFINFWWAAYPFSIDGTD